MIVRQSISIVTLQISIVLLLMGCNTNKRKSPTSENSTQTSEKQPTATTASAKQLFTEHCKGCHGQAANDFVAHDWKYGNSKEEIYNSISNGMPENGMPAYDKTFTTTEIEQLTAYIIEDLEQEAAVVPQPVTKSPDVELETVVTNREIPWAIEVTADGTIYFTERQGTLSYIPPGGQAIAVSGVPQVLNERQGGLLDLKLHPDFAANKQLFLSYSKPGTNGLATTAVCSATLEGNALTNVTDIFVAKPYYKTQHHYGSRLAFDKAGLLYITVGDRGNRDVFPQSLENGCGKVHRITITGEVPADNPFYKQANAVKSVWSYGHRNPQGLVYDQADNSLWEHEHGPKGGDEINLIQKGLNYGWPVITYGVNYSGFPITKLKEKEGLEQPVSHWTPSIAPSGMDLVNDKRYGNWEGCLLSGSLKFDYISKVTLKARKHVSEDKIFEGIGRVREIEMGDDGFLYIGVENPGRILKVIAN